MTRHVTRVDFEPGESSDVYCRSALVPACSCGWSSHPYYCSDLAGGVSHETARKKAEEQCTEHRLRVAVEGVDVRQTAEEQCHGEHVTRIGPGLDRPSFVVTCSCGWSGEPCYWSNLTTSVSEVRARAAAEEQGAGHLRSQGRGGSVCCRAVVPS